MSVHKKLILSVFLFWGLILMSGCQTAKGATNGIVGSVGAVTSGIAGTACGAAKDTVSLWQGILKADDWIKKNLW